MLHELRENGSAGIHPSLSAIGPGVRAGGFAANSRRKKFKSKNPSSPPNPLIQRWLSGSAENLAGQQ